MSKNSTQKEYIVKLKNTKLYLKSVDPKNIEYTFDLEKAEKANKEDLNYFSKIDELEIIKYENELYKVKSENYKLYIAAILNSEGEIKRDDLISFCQEYEFAADGSGKFTAYIDLKEEYPNSKLIDELIRLGKLIEQQSRVTMYEMLVNMSKDKEFNIRNNNRVEITENDTKEYNNAKLYLEEMKQKYPFDYDIEKQYNIVDTAFRDKYISEDLYKEFYELYYDEEYEPNSI